MEAVLVVHSIEYGLADCLLAAHTQTGESSSLVRLVLCISRGYYGLIILLVYVSSPQRLAVFMFFGLPR